MSANTQPSILNVNGFSNALRIAWDAITAGVGAVIFIFELVVGSVASLFLFLIAFVWAIPIVGRLLRQLWGFCQSVIYRVLGLPDLLAWLARIRPAKKLRLRVIVVHDGSGPVAPKATVLTEVQELVDIFYDKANIRVIPDNPLVFRTGFHQKETAGDAFIYEMSKSPKAIIKVRSSFGAYLQDLWVQGFWYELLMARHDLWGNFRRLIGYGAPLVVIAVKDYHSSAIGNSLGAITDYLTVEGPETADKTTIAHEVGHSCGLLHDKSAGNFMHASAANPRDLSSGQALWIRNSRHVTYF
jgi:hypothetical protein